MSSSVRKPIHIKGRRLVLTKNMIMESQSNTKSAMAAARWLGVSYNTYKKWSIKINRVRVLKRVGLPIK